MKQKRLYVTTELLQSIIGLGCGVTIPGEPVPDLKIVDVRFDTWTNTVVFLVESEQFEEVPEGADVPTWTPAFAKVYA